MNPEWKCFWLNLAAWALMLAGIPVVVLFRGLGGKISAAAIFASAWVLSLFGLIQWEHIPEKEREKQERASRFLRVKHTIIWQLPLVLPIFILLVFVLD